MDVRLVHGGASAEEAKQEDGRLVLLPSPMWEWLVVPSGWSTKEAPATPAPVWRAHRDMHSRHLGMRFKDLSNRPPCQD